MSDPKNCHGSIETHDLFLNPLDPDYPPHRIVNGKTTIDWARSVRPKEMASRDLFLLFVHVSDQYQSIEACGNMFPPLDVWDSAQFTQWIDNNPVLINVLPNSTDREKTIGQFLWHSICRHTMREWKFQQGLMPMSDLDLDLNLYNAMYYLYQGYETLICPYREMLIDRDGKESTRYTIFHNRIVGLRSANIE